MESRNSRIVRHPEEGYRWDDPPDRVDGPQRFGSEISDAFWTGGAATTMVTIEIETNQHSEVAFMFARMGNAWRIGKECLRVLRQDKELVMFPVFSGLACLVVMISFAIPVWASSDVRGIANGAESIVTVVHYVVLFLFYLANYLVILFFNSALISCAIIRFRGGNPTVSDGLRAAWHRLPQIFNWALVSATVGFVLRIVESQSERFGQIISGLFGSMWSLMTYFVLPVLVVERTGPVDAVKRSMALMRETWGEMLVASVGIGMIVFVAILPAIGMIVVGFMSGALLGGVLLTVGVLLLLGIFLVSSALESILQAALYLFAAEGTSPPQFDNSLLESAFRSR